MQITSKPLLPLPIYQHNHSSHQIRGGSSRMWSANKSIKQVKTEVYTIWSVGDTTICHRKIRKIFLNGIWIRQISSWFGWVTVISSGTSSRSEWFTFHVRVFNFHFTISSHRSGMDYHTPSSPQHNIMLYAIQVADSSINFMQFSFLRCSWRLRMNHTAPNWVETHTHSTHTDTRVGRQMARARIHWILNTLQNDENENKYIFEQQNHCQ